MDPKNPSTPSPSLPTDENPVESQSDMPRSRISKSTIKHTKKSIALMVLGILTIFFLLIFFGVSGLQKLTEIAIKEKEDDNAAKKETNIILPPTLNSEFSATNSAEISLTGSVDSGEEVKLFINGALSDKTKVDNGEFTFEDVTLREGVNSLKAKVVVKGKESNFSDAIKIIYYGEPPQLDIISPAEGRTFRSDNNPILVSGKTNQQAKVTVLGHRAIMESSGNFEYSLTLTHGENDIVIIATDPAGNTTEKRVKAILE